MISRKVNSAKGIAVTVNLATYFDVLRRRKWTVILTALAATLVIGLGSMTIAPTYRAQTQLQVSAAKRGSASYGDVLQAERMMKTYAEIATSEAVRNEMKRAYGLSETPWVDAEIVANTELIAITVQHQNPEVSAKVANTVGELLVTQSRRLREFRSHPVSVITRAVPSSETSDLNLPLNLVLGLIAGLLGGLGLAFVFENLDTTLRSPDQIEQVTDLTALGELPLNRAAHPIVFAGGSSLGSEAYRTLRTNIQGFENYQQLQTLMVTSALPKEGKTTTAVNLAIAMAQAGQDVVLVDCDLRHPTIHQVLNMPNQIGVSSALIQDIPAEKVLKQSLKYGMHVVTSGPIVRSPVELLGSDSMRSFLNELSQQFSSVILDVPSVLSVADASVLAPMVDGVAIVVGTNIANQKSLTTAHRRLGVVNANIIGTIINRAEYNYLQSYV